MLKFTLDFCFWSGFLAVDGSFDGEEGGVWRMVLDSTTANLSDEKLEGSGGVLAGRGRSTQKMAAPL